MRRAGRALAAVAALAAGLALTTTALADARTEARRHFRAGMEAIAKGRYEAAVDELEQANAILPHPNVSYNIARALVELGRLEEAVAAYRDYLASTPPDRDKVAKILEQIEEKLALQKAERERASAAPPAPAPAPAPTVAPTPTPAPSGTAEPSAPLAPTATPVAPPPEPPKATPSPKEAEALAGNARTEDVYEETVVTASRGAQSPLDSPSSTTILTRQDIQLSGITRIPELLRRVAGMDVMQITGGDTNVSMRGFNSRLANKLLVLVDGRSVYFDFIGSTFWESLTIDVDQIERIEVVRGPGSALYGADAFSGIVNIITRAPGAGKPGARLGGGDHGQAYGSVWASGREGDFAYRASAGYTRYPRWTREIAPGRVDLSVSDANQNVGSQNIRFDVRATRRWGQDVELDIGGGYSKGDLDIYGIGPFNDYVVHFDNANVTTALRTKYVNARVYYSRLSATSGVDYAYQGHTLFEAHPNQNVLDAEIVSGGAFEWPGSVKQDVRVGVGYRMKDITWEYLQPDVPIEHHASAFLQDSIRFTNWAELVASGRIDYVPYLQKVVPSPRGSLIFKPTDRQAIRASGSTAFRTPSYLEAYLGLPIQLSTPGAEFVSATKRADDPSFRLQPEQIVTAEASYLNQQSELFEFELTAYYNRVSQLILLADVRPDTLSSRKDGVGGLDPATGLYAVANGGWQNSCDTYNVGGGEVGARFYPLDGLDLFANYALNVGVQERPDGCNVPDDKRTSRHKVNAGVQWRTKFGLNGEITFHYQSPQTWREQVATSTGIEYRLFDLPAYTLLNGRVGYRFYRDRMEVSTTVFNALADAFGDPAQQHPFGNRVGRRVMGFFSYSLGGTK
jgi:iron complex outermembrane receptor protein